MVVAMADLWPLIKVRGGQRSEVDVGGSDVEGGIVEGDLLVAGGVLKDGGAMGALRMDEDGGLIGEPVDPKTMAGEDVVAEPWYDGDGVAKIVKGERCSGGNDGGDGGVVAVGGLGW